MENEMEQQETPKKKPLFKVPPVVMTVIFGVTIAALTVGAGFVFWKLLGVLK